MYNPISISVNESILESFNIDILPEKNEDSVYTEAVFQNGKAKLKKAEEIMQKIKDELESEIKKQIDGDKSKNEKTVKNSKFDPKGFWKNHLWKEFEDEISKVFNFRSVIINPYIERYNSKKDQFESNELNAFTYSMDRYTIDGLITDDGLYDKTRSIILEIYISLGIIRTCTAGELIAILLHEIGHNIDPALVSVSYTGTNILCKYLTNRNLELKKNEKHFFDKFKIYNDNNFIKFFTTLNIVSNSVKMKLKNTLKPILSLNPFSKLIDKMHNKKYDKIANKIMDTVSKDKIQFNYQEYTEAFADNFARMYGYGNELSKAFKLLNDNMIDQIHNSPWFKKEYSRRQAVANMVLFILDDPHKTDIHRIKAMIREYDKDINDPNIPDKVKEYLKEDKKSCEDVLNEYINNKDEFYKRIYNIINDAIDELDKDYKEKNYNESNTDDSVEEFTEKSHGKLKYSFRMGINTENGHLVKIVFDLNKDDVAFVGSHDNTHPVDDKDQDRIINNINKTGYTDFVSKGKVLAIIDMDTKERLQSVNATGVMSGLQEYAKQPLKERERRAKDDFAKLRGGKKYVVGQIEGADENGNMSRFQQRSDGTYKSTKPANNLDDLSKFQNDPIKYGRGYHKEKNYNESNTDETIYESKKAYEKLMKSKKSLTSDEYAEVHKKFGYSKECSFAKDKNGYYCFTHRARSKSYPTIDDIPQKSVDFIRSTS